MQPLTSAAISASVSGVSTTNGYSTRQSVASVTCETRLRPSNLMLSLAVTRPSTRGARRRSSATWSNCSANAVTAPLAACSSSPTAASRSASPSGVRRFSHFAEPVVQRLDQQLAALRVVEQVVLQVRVALHDPDVAQHLVQHARRAAGLALVAQAVQQLPGARAEQADHDLAVGERGVVVRDLAQARRVGRGLGGGADLAQGEGCVHGVRGRGAASRVGTWDRIVPQAMWHRSKGSGRHAVADPEACPDCRTAASQR